MTSGLVYDTEGGLHVLWLVATADSPMTAAEIAAHSEMAVQTAGRTARKLHRSGYVLRRERKEGGLGQNPYEYRLAPRAVRETD